MFAGCRQSEVKRQEGICQLTTVVQSPLGGHHLNGERWGQLPRVLLPVAQAVQQAFTRSRYSRVADFICATGDRGHKAHWVVTKLAASSTTSKHSGSVLTNVNGEMGTASKSPFTCATCIYVY